jgi:hypothetical protein
MVSPRDGDAARLSLFAEACLRTDESVKIYKINESPHPD